MKCGRSAAAELPHRQCPVMERIDRSGEDLRTVGFLRMKPLRGSRIATAFLVMIAFAAFALAHDTWLIPARFSLARDPTVLLDLTSGMAFPTLNTSIRPDRVALARYRLANHSYDIADASPAPNSLRLKARLNGQGIATFWVQLKPRSLGLTPEKVREYLDEIDAPGWVREQWENAKRPRRWREVYTKHAKTFVRVGEITADRSWADPTGMSLEIVPETDPTSLRRGDELRVRVLKNGAGLRNFPLGIVREGIPNGDIQRTDAEGRATFRLPRSGRWLLRGTELRKAIQSGADWESDFTTLTIEVAEK